MKITDTRLMIIDVLGNIVSEPYTIGKQHQEIMDSYAKSKNYEYSDVSYIVSNGDIVFYNLDNNYVVSYMPSVITDDQLYDLELLSIDMDDIEYMEVRKLLDNGKYQDFILDGDVGMRFSNEVVQSYYNKKDEKVK